MLKKNCCALAAGCCCGTHSTQHVLHSNLLLRSENLTFPGISEIGSWEKKYMKALLCLIGKAVATGGFLGYVCFTQSIQTGSAQEITIQNILLHGPF